MGMVIVKASFFLQLFSKVLSQITHKCIVALLQKQKPTCFLTTRQFLFDNLFFIETLASQAVSFSGSANCVSSGQSPFNLGVLYDEGFRQVPEFKLM